MGADLDKIKNELTIVIPTLNEEEAIGRVIDELLELGYKKEQILVVDGYSEDNTRAIAQSKGVRVVLQSGPGKAGAIKTAIEHVNTRYMLVMDGDGTYDPRSIDNLLYHAERFDEVIGKRAEGRENIPLLNRIGNWIITKAFNVLFGEPITDVCSGMYLLKTEFAKGLEITSTSFDVEVEVASQAAANGRITEAPIRYRRRIGKQKLKSWRHGTRIIRTLLWMASYYNPVFFYSALLSLAAIPAALILLWVIYESLVRHVWHSGYALFGVMLFLLASQAGAVAVISILFKRMEKRIFEKLAREGKAR